MLYIFTGQNHVRRGIAVISKAVTLNFFFSNGDSAS